MPERFELLGHDPRSARVSGIQLEVVVRTEAEGL